MKLTLRPYQTDALGAIETAEREGVRRPLVVHPTGTGKGVVMGAVASRREDRGRSIVLVHREELADQFLEKLGWQAPHLRTGVVKAERDELDADVVVASVPTAQSDERLRRLVESARRSPFGTIIADECFPTGTMVGGVPIEDLRAGDRVPSWNEETGAVELRPVVRVMSRKPLSLVRVELETGEHWSCTSEHPILTDQGWSAAGSLARGVSVVSFTHDAPSELYGVLPTVRDRRSSEVGSLPEGGPSVLLGHLPGPLGGSGPVRPDGSDQPGACLGADDGAQPDAPSGVGGQDEGDTARDWAQAAHSGRQRDSGHRASTAAGGVPGLADRSGDRAEGRGAPLSLPSGYRAPDDAGGDRGGRPVTFFGGPPRLRPAEGTTAHITRVAGVQILEPGGDGAYGGVCPDGLVYNLEVGATHTYLIGSGVVVHNCHHAPAPSWTKVLNGLGAFNPHGPLAVGFTATPERDGKTLGVWEKVVSYMSIREAIFLGYLVPIAPALVIQTKMDLTKIRKGGNGDLSGGDLGREMEDSGAVEEIADGLIEHASERKILAFTPTVATAHALAAALVRRGMTAEAVDGETPTELRTAIKRRLKTGETRCVVNCGVFTEGFDEPSIDCVAIARATKFHGFYLQMAGRGTRLSPGKTDLLIVDFVGATQRHDLITRVDIGDDLDQKAKKPEEPGEGQACPTCELPCEVTWHRCTLCRRYLPAGRVKDGEHRHENCQAGTAGTVDVFGASRLRWLPVGASWCLGAGQEIVVMVPAGLDTWRLASYRNGKVAVLHEQIPADWAMGIGEDRAKAFQKLVERDARWLRQPVSDLQRGRLLREGLPERSLPKVKTRGEAADLLTRIQGRRAVKKLGVSVLG